MDRAKRRSPDREDEEVYRIRSDDDDDDEEEQSDQDGEAVEDESEDQSDDMRSDISGDEDEEGCKLTFLCLDMGILAWSMGVGMHGSWGSRQT